MTKALRLAPDLTLPLDSVSRTFGLLAVRGAGKSNTAAVMAEEMFKAQLPFVVIDPVGSWYGLRSSADGSAPGLPIPIFGGKHGDVPLERGAGELVADLVVEKRLTCVLDLSRFDSESDKKAFLLAFARRLYLKNENPLHLFLEEADDYIPQKPMADEAQLLRAWENIVRRGRSRGLGMTLITQRSAAINKMVLTQVETLFAMRTTGPQDIAAIEAWVKYHQAGLEVLSTLASLEDGEAWVWSPHFLKTMSRHQIRRRATFDSGATPTNVRAKEARPPATLADIDLGSIQSQMAATIEKAKADDPRELRKQIADLKRQLAQGALQAEPIRQEVPALTEKDRAILSTMSDRIHALSMFLNTEAEAIVESVRVKVAAAINTATADMLSLLANGADEATERLQQVGFNRVLDKIPVIHPTAQATVQPRSPQARRVAPALAQATSSRPARLVSDVVGANGLPKGSRKILTALAQYPQGRSKTQIAILTSYAHNGGGFNNYLSALRSLGFIDGAGDRLVITDAGLAALGPYEELPTGRDLVDHWMRQLGKAERLILETLVTAHPRAMTKDAVAQATNYEANGGGFNNALSRLRALELIGGRGELRASEELFS